MQSIKSISLFCIGMAACAGVYLAMRSALWPSELLVLLNSLFVGAVIAVAMAYGPLILSTVTGKQPYDRVWQMTTGFAALWLALCLFVATHFYDATELGFAARFVGIIAATLQVTAPDFGLGIFHGRDRKFLWLSSAVAGTLAAAFIVAERL